MDRETAKQVQKRVMARLGYDHVGDWPDGYPRFRLKGGERKKPGAKARIRKDHPRIGSGITLPAKKGDPKGFGVRITCQREKDVESDVVKRAQREAPPGEKIPAVFIGRIKLAATAKKKAKKKAAGLKIGDSVGRSPLAEKAKYGSIGCFVKLNRAGGDYILSCNHVLANFPPVPPPPDKMLSKARFFGGTITQNHVADLHACSDLVVDELDCAIARIRPGVQFDGTNVHGLPNANGPVAISGNIMLAQNLDGGEPVSKVGCASHGTSGTIFSVNETHTADDGISMVEIGGQLAVVGDAGVYFAAPGDSGSVVFNQAMDVVGMVVAISLVANITFCHPIFPVFDHFDAHF